MTKSLHRRIISLGREIEGITTKNTNTDANRGPKWPHTFPRKVLSKVIADMKSLLDRIDRDIPLLQLAITASGESLSTSLPSTISPSRLLQASAFVIMGDSQFAQNSTKPVQVGPTFSLSLYMLFVAHDVPNGGGTKFEDSRTDTYGLGENDKKPIWQEVMHKVAVRLYRSASDTSSKLYSSGRKAALPTTNEHMEYHYYLEVMEDLNDGRVHDDLNLDASSGIGSSSHRQEIIPVHQFSKIFYTDTGKLLNIRDPMDAETRPVLLLKRDAGTSPQMIPEAECCTSAMGYVGDRGDQSRDIDDYQDLVDIQIHREACNTSIDKNTTQYSVLSNLPKHLDPEWLALEIFVEDDSNDEEEGGAEDTIVAPEISYHNEAVSDSNRAEPAVQIEHLHRASGTVKLDSTFLAQLEGCSIEPTSNTIQPIDVSTEHNNKNNNQGAHSSPSSPFSAVTTSLSLLEMMIRLVGLQEFQQTSHLSIPDRILTFFLEEASTTGVSGSAREKVRRETKQRVGFDPYVDDQER